MYSFVCRCACIIVLLQLFLFKELGHENLALAISKLYFSVELFTVYAYTCKPYNNNVQDTLCICNMMMYAAIVCSKHYTVYVKSFKGENFHGFLLTAKVLPLKIFLEYWHCPSTTRSMVLPGLKFLTAQVFLTY